ncbi:MAG: cysteine methyltransferase [Bradyrhizobium sp.]|jgi:AraC family transcriptional regulator of adaptative response/methylated-DNA-[protein]-cysteine methyltransferase|nr:cysteine methyltransferase [Bradyrhizobium sp.]
MSDVIRYAFGKTSFGDVLVAASDKGVVALEFVDDSDVAEELFHSRFPGADVVSDQEGLSLLLSRIRRTVDQPDGGSDIELDLRGTPYEIQVWNLLREIAVGETTSYGALAAKLGTRDARDVTKAISANPIAILVPCHRVLKKDGSISGYRWGVRRKRALLEREQLALRGRK